MILNCKELGLDWERASLSDFLEAMAFHNEQRSDEGPRRAPPSQEDRERLEAVMAART